MPATRSFPPDLVPPITQASLLAWLRDCLIAAGFPQPLKSFTIGTEQFCIWRLDFDATKTWGRAFYRLRVTAALQVSHLIAAGFTDATNAVASPSADSHLTAYTSNVALKAWGFRNEEMTILSISQGALHQILGFFRFADAPSFDETSFPKIWISRNDTLTSITSTALNPYGTTFVFPTSMGNALLSDPDPYLQQRSQATGMLVYGSNSNGIIARSNDDLSSGACAAMVRGDIFQNPNVNPIENFVLLKPGAGALLIKF